MSENLKYHYPNVFFKHFIVFALFFPFFISNIGNAYYPDFILVNLFSFLFIITIIITKQIRITRKDFLAFSLGIALILYNLSALYVNHKYLHWYSDQINVSLAFLMFITLLLVKNNNFFDNDRLIRFLIHSIVVSNVIGIFIYMLGYSGVSFLNNQIQFIPVDVSYYERRFNWIYFHKSQYSLMLVLFLALFVVYRRQFRSKWTYMASIGVLFTGLIISHTYTSLLASLFIFAGQFCDFLKQKLSFLKLKHILLSLPVFGAIGGIVFLFVSKMARERNIWTLGGRIPIWKESFHILKCHPAGIGTSFGAVSFNIPGLSFDVYNCHNLFLNQMLRFSIPVGLCYTGMFGLIIIASFVRNFSFLTLGIWVALLIPMNMDYSLLTTELPLMLFVLFCIFFRKDNAKHSVES